MGKASPMPVSIGRRPKNSSTNWLVLCAQDSSRRSKRPRNASSGIPVLHEGTDGNITVLRTGCLCMNAQDVEAPDMPYGRQLSGCNSGERQKNVPGTAELQNVGF